MPFGAFANGGAAATAALDYDTRALALDLAPHGVRANVVTPGPVATPGGAATRMHFGGATNAPDDAFVSYVPPGRFGTPDDVAEVVALLLSDRDTWLTGENYRVDGGMTAR